MAGPACSVARKRELTADNPHCQQQTVGEQYLRRRTREYVAFTRTLLMSTRGKLYEHEPTNAQSCSLWPSPNDCGALCSSAGPPSFAGVGAQCSGGKRRLLASRTGRVCRASCRAVRPR